MTIAYLRVSTVKQHAENQKNEIQRFAQENGLAVDRWITETVSGKTSKNRRKLGKVLRSMRRGDVLIVSEVSRLSRNLTEIMSIVGECLEKGVDIYSIKERYHFDDSINSKVLCFAFGLVAEIERNLISQRTKEALALRKAEGKTLGRRKGCCPKKEILEANRDDIVSMMRRGAQKKEICEKYGVSSETLRTFIRDFGMMDL